MPLVSIRINRTLSRRVRGVFVGYFSDYFGCGGGSVLKNIVILQYMQGITFPDGFLGGF
jgi:hypothetical protein